MRHNTEHAYPDQVLDVASIQEFVHGMQRDIAQKRSAAHRSTRNILLGMAALTAYRRFTGRP